MPADPAKIREALGLPADASDDDVGQAITAAGLVKTTAPPVAGGAPDDVPAQLAAAAGAAGAVVLSRGVWAETEERLREGAAAAQKLRENKREQVIGAALAEGRIKSDEVEYWSNLWDSNASETEKVMAKLAKNRVPVAPIGYAASTDQDDIDEEFAHLFRATPRGGR